MKLDVGDLKKDCLIRGLRAHIRFLEGCLLDPGAQERLAEAERALAAAEGRVEELEKELCELRERQAADEKRSLSSMSTVDPQSARSMVSEQEEKGLFRCF